MPPNEVKIWLTAVYGYMKIPAYHLALKKIKLQKPANVEFTKFKKEGLNYKVGCF